MRTRGETRGPPTMPCLARTRLPLSLFRCFFWDYLSLSVRRCRSALLPFLFLPLFFFAHPSFVCPVVTAGAPPPAACLDTPACLPYTPTKARRPPADVLIPRLPACIQCLLMYRPPRKEPPPPPSPSSPIPTPTPYRPSARHPAYPGARRAASVATPVPQTFSCIYPPFRALVARARVNWRREVRL